MLWRQMLYDSLQACYITDCILSSLSWRGYFHSSIPIAINRAPPTTAWNMVGATVEAEKAIHYQPQAWHAKCQPQAGRTIN